MITSILQKRILFLPIILCYAYLLSGQQGININTLLDSSVYRVSNQDLSTGKLVNYCFPPLEAMDSYKFSVVEAVKTKNRINSNSTEKYCCSFNLESPIYLSQEKELFLKIKLYAKDLKKINVAIEVSDQNYEITSMELRKDRNYFNFTLPLGKLANKIYFQKDTVDSLFLSGLEVFTDYPNNGKLIMGDALFYSQIKIEANSEDSFYQAMINTYPIVTYNSSLVGFCENEVIKNVSLYEDMGIEYLKYPINKEYDYERREQLSEKEIVLEVSNKVNQILEKYNEVENERFNVLLDSCKLLAELSDLDSLYYILSEYLYKFNDTHLRLALKQSGSEMRGIAPLYFYELKGELQVVAVLDSTLINTISNGDKLLAINQQSVNDVVKELHKHTTGGTSHARQRKIVQKLLHKVCYYYNIDSLNLTLEDIFGQEYSVLITQSQVTKNKHISIPENISNKRKLLDYKNVEGLSYIKIGAFQDRGLRSFIYTYMDSINNTDGIILDLRNNSSGDFSFGFLLSFLLNKPGVIFSHIKNNSSSQTIVVEPDDLYYFDKPIAIIVDARTTCASEFLISTLLKYKSDITIIGASKTGGGAQRQEVLKLPETDVYDPILYFRSDLMLDAAGKDIDEESGISPTMWCSLESFMDLAPYNDKLLQVAIKYLNAYK